MTTEQISYITTTFEEQFLVQYQNIGIVLIN